MDRSDKTLKSSLEIERRCSKCHHTKPIGGFASLIKLDFNGDEVDVHQSNCRECAAKYIKEYNQKRKSAYHKKTNAWTFLK